MIFKNLRSKQRERINKTHKINTKKHLLKLIIFKDKEEERLLILSNKDGLLMSMKHHKLYKNQSKVSTLESKRNNT
jgi:hypothetical protein